MYVAKAWNNSNSFFNGIISLEPPMGICYYNDHISITYHNYSKVSTFKQTWQNITKLSKFLVSGPKLENHTF